ncbi:TPA: site-specific integrase [Burkholderia vietnamiensis]|nr:site-specific integrase [Burkholderia vietnamiensis]
MTEQVQVVPTEKSIKISGGTVVSRTKKDGSLSYQAKYRKAGVNVSETFSTIEKATEWLSEIQTKVQNGEPVQDKFKPVEKTVDVGLGTVVSRTKKDGSLSYQARVRKNGVNLSDTFTTEKDAKNWITKIEARLLNGEEITVNKIKKTTLAEVFKEFLEDNDKKLSDNKKGRLNRLILEIGKVKIEEFKTSFLHKWVEFKLSQVIPDQANKKKSHKLYNGNRDIDDHGNEVMRTYQPSTIRKYYYDIKNALEYHAKMHDYQFNSKPFDEVDPPEGWTPRDRRLEEGELDRLIKACETLYVNVEPTKILIRFLVYSAFRIGETMLIKWKDIKLNLAKPEESCIFIPKENQKIAHKKGAKDRYASLRPELFALIKDELLPYKEGKKDTDYVFDFWSSARYFYTRYKNVCFNAGIKGLTIHDLRHEGCSWFFENTTLTDIEIANITGHIELSTLQKYAKLRPNKTGAKLWNSIIQ